MLTPVQQSGTTEVLSIARLSTTTDEESDSATAL